MISTWLKISDVRNHILIPKYYDPSIQETLSMIDASHDLLNVGELVRRGVLSFSTGDEIGKMAYGTGSIPFVRTSDISNWEIKTSPKQGVSHDIYDKYAAKQDVKSGDILLVKDGTYLIGTNCFVSRVDREILFQSHILKVRIDRSYVDPMLVFLSLNSPVVQRQIRSFQFTADTIDTIGLRYNELVLPIPKDEKRKGVLVESAGAALSARERGRAFIQHIPRLLEAVLQLNSTEPLEEFFSATWDSVLLSLSQPTVTSDLGLFRAFWMQSSLLKSRTLLPKYYSPDIKEELTELGRTCDCVSMGDLRESGEIDYYTGDEVGKMAYGTGSIPFIRTSDFASWELKHDPKHAVSESIYSQYASRQDVREGDILLVRDGTYLVGTSTIVTSADPKLLFCGGLYKIRIKQNSRLDRWLLLALLNSLMVMDKAYEGDEAQKSVARAGFTPVVPPKANRKAPWQYDRELYKAQ